MFLALNSKGLYQSLGKEKQSCCRVFPSSTKREFRHFHVVSCNDGKEMYKKRGDARAELLFCLSKRIAFLPFSLPSPHRCLSSLLGKFRSPSDVAVLVLESEGF